MVEVSPWTIEEIPDTDTLYRWLKKTKFENQFRIPLNAFVDTNGISTDWEKYSTPIETLNRSPESSKFAVIQANVGRIREIIQLIVQHSPSRENRSHTNIHGLNACPPNIQTDIRRRLARTFDITPEDKLT
jgi:hypothetical protein